MNILVTGGSTWIKIDEVRVITNIFTGRTGLYLAKYFKRKGCNVTFLFNPHCLDRIPKSIRAIPFRYFDELKNILEEELKLNRYDVIIHSAAVSDYKLRFAFKGKIPSGKKELILKLVPTPKLIKIIRNLGRNSFIVQFKLEIEKEGLMKKAYQSLKNNKSDLVVANSWEDLKSSYKAFIIDKKKNVREVDSLKSLGYFLWEGIKTKALPSK
ncbi:MAG: hypothetical protein NC820_05090 [Candidatus Omnitrophica bacterium]|nr:hypothetical protein [Candidatus Omnitrophota bacterium]